MSARAARLFSFYLGSNPAVSPARLLFCPRSHQKFRFLSTDSAAEAARVTFDKAGAANLTIGDRRFVVLNDSTTLANLAENIQKEGVTSDAIVFQSRTDAVQFAQQSTSAWHVLAAQPVQLVFDGKSLNVEVDGEPPVALPVAASSELLIKAENELAKKAEALRKELQPLDAKVQDMLQGSHRRTRIMSWIGLAYMSAQFGFLARLTWWDYSWDIVEPITYFVTYGTGLFFYSYYVVTRQEANFAAMFDRQQLITVHKRITRSNFDLPKYNKLRDDLHDVESQLSALHQSVDWQVIGSKKPTSA